MVAATYPKEPLRCHIHWFLAEARDQGEAAAGAGGAVAEEMTGVGGTDGAGGVGSGVDLGGGDAGLAEGVAVGGPQVEEPAAGADGSGADERGGRAERLG